MRLKPGTINPYAYNCRVCGRPYKPKVWNQQTCSEACRKKLKKGRVTVDESIYAKSKRRVR